MHSLTHIQASEHNCLRDGGAALRALRAAVTRHALDGGHAVLTQEMTTAQREWNEVSNTLKAHRAHERLLQRFRCSRSLVALHVCLRDAGRQFGNLSLQFRDARHLLGQAGLRGRLY